MGLKPCGCTYRDIGDPVRDSSHAWLGTRLRLIEDMLAQPDGVTWSTLTQRLGARNSDEFRDGLHRLLHRIATPEMTPKEGKGRKGTLWRAK